MGFDDRFILNEENAVAIDNLARSGNFAAIQRQRDAMIDLLGRTAQFFDYVDKNKTRSICEQLQKKGYGVSESWIAFDKIRDTCQRFPSFAEILSLMPKRLNKDPIAKAQHMTVMKDEEFLEAQIEAKFIQLLGEDKLEPYCKWWLKECMGLDNEQLSFWGMTFMVFKRCALIDWHDSFYTSDFSRIKNVVQEKNKQVQEIHIKNRKRMRMGHDVIMQVPRINGNIKLTEKEVEI